MEADWGKVGVLITAESIIAGFMIAYATLATQMLFSWSRVQGASLFTTLQAGLLASAVVLTCFRSILLLYESADHKPADKSETVKTNYRAGYDLFVAAILLSGIYVILNVLSIYHFTLHPMPISPPVADVLSFVELVGFFLYVWILLHRPKMIQDVLNCLSGERGRTIAEILGWIGVAVAVVIFLLSKLLGFE